MDFLQEIDKLQNRKELSTNNVRNSLHKKGYNDIDLCSYYMTGFTKVGRSFNSDLRFDDKNASLTTMWSKDGNIQISDFGYKTGMSIFSYIQEKYFESGSSGYYKALDKVCVDFKLEDIIPHYGRDSKAKRDKAPVKLGLSTQVKQEVTILKKARPFEQRDVDYWNQFGITIQQLQSKRIEAISKFQIINPNKDSNSVITIPNTDIAYAYPEWRNGKEYYKIYLPYGLKGNKDFKWFSNITNEIVFNLRFTNRLAKTLIIQSSYKDAMVMENFGYASIPLNGEGMWFNEDIWDKLRMQYMKIIYFADNDSNKDDNPGITLAKKWASKYNIKYISTPDNTVSDISDYYKTYGHNKTEELLNELLKDEKK